MLLPVILTLAIQSFTDLVLVVHVLEVVELFLFRELPLGVLDRDIDPKFPELPTDPTDIVAGRAFEVSCSTHHRKLLNTNSVEIPATTWTSQSPPVRTVSLHLFVTDDTVLVWRCGEQVHLLFDPVVGTEHQHFTRKLKCRP